MAKTLYYNAVTEEMEFVNNPSPLRENLGERFGLNEGGRINMKPGGIVEPGVMNYGTVKPMPKGMEAWLKKNKIEVVWEDISRVDRVKLKSRFANRNNPYLLGLEQKKIFEEYIEGLIKKGKTITGDKGIDDLVKDSKADITRDTAQDVITDKKFAVKGSKMEKIFPKLEARAIELLNQGLPGPEVTTILENEGIIKVNKSWDESKGRLTRDIRPFTNVYQRLLNAGKIKKIAKTIAGTQIPTAERTIIDKAVLDYIKKNPDIDSSHHIAKGVSAELNRDITKDWVENTIKRSGQEPDKLFQSANKKIFSDVKILDKLIKNNQKLLDSDISFKEKSRIFTKRYAEATGKPLKIAAGEFITRIRKLGDLYAGQPQRYEKKLYSTIKAPANYVGSSFHKNFVSLADASGQVSVVEKAKLLGLPQKEIKLLSELSFAVGKLGGFSMAGDHTDIDALMKNFANYRKEFTRIEWVRNSLNNFKRSYDQKIMSLYAAAKRGQTTVMVDGEPVAIKDRIKFFQDEFKNKTGYHIGGFKIDAKGEPYIKPTTPRIPDIKNPVNTVLRQTLQGLETYRMPAQKPIEITNAFDKAMMRVRNAGERIEAFKKWKGKSELLNSRYIKALGAIPRLKGFVKLLTAGTITLGGMTALAQADTGDETLEPSDAKQETSVLPSVIQEHPILSGAAATVAPIVAKKAWEGVKWAGRKLLPIMAPGVSHAFKLWEGKPYDPTSGHDATTMAFWKSVIDTMGKTSKLGDANVPLMKRLKDLAWRGGLPTRFLPLISGAASTVAGPMLIKDAAAWLQNKIDEEGLTGLIEKQSGMIGDEAGASLLMEDVQKEKKRRDAEGMDHAQGGLTGVNRYTQLIK